MFLILYVLHKEKEIYSRLAWFDDTGHNITIGNGYQNDLLEIIAMFTLLIKIDNL